MARLTLDVDEDTLNRMRTSAEAAGLSLSDWLLLVIRERTQPTDWPKRVLALAGCWPEMPTAEELRADLVPDLPREPF
jgi:hypothetical protein